MNPWMTDPGSEQEGGGGILPDVLKLLPLRPHLLSFFFFLALVSSLNGTVRFSIFLLTVTLHGECRLPEKCTYPDVVSLSLRPETNPFIAAPDRLGRRQDKDLQR